VRRVWDCMGFTGLPATVHPVFHLGRYINAEWGSTMNCQLAILTDFFTHGFDGSGADNFMDAGSCIDGRLTSAWEWCSKLVS
jgi:hypothetical protein